MTVTSCCISSGHLPAKVCVGQLPLANSFVDSTPRWASQATISAPADTYCSNFFFTAKYLHGKGSPERERANTAWLRASANLDSERKPQKVGSW